MEQRAIATEFISNEFFKTEKRLFLFLELIFGEYHNMIDTFREKYQLEKDDVFFIFKGGNILRIVAREFFLEVPENSSRELIDYYSAFFKRSDADFSIMLNPELKNYEYYLRELVNISYTVQCKIRDIFLKKKMDYFDFFCYKPEYQKKIFCELRDKLQYADLSLENLNCDGLPYMPPQDYIYISEAQKEYIKGNKSFINISINESFDETSAVGWRTKFSLIRSKVHFASLVDGKKRGVDGELIDVTINHRDGSEIPSFFEHVEDYVSEYTLKRKSKSISFRSYSLEYLIKDIEKILFKNVDYPWDDSKYAKRLNRLMFFYFVELFSKLDSWEERMRQLELLKNTLNGDYQKKIQGSLRLSVFEDHLIELSKKDYDPEKLSEMNDVILKNVDFLEKTIQNIKSYCRVDGNVSEDDISETSMEEYI